MSKIMAAQKIRSRTRYFDKIIQVNVPVRFYWAEGEFDGIEFGPFEGTVSRHQEQLVHEVLEVIQELLETGSTTYKAPKSHRKPKQKVPQVFINAFKEKEGNHGS